MENPIFVAQKMPWKRAEADAHRSLNTGDTTDLVLSPDTGQPGWWKKDYFYRWYIELVNGIIIHKLYDDEYL